MWRRWFAIPMPCARLWRPTCRHWTTSAGSGSKPWRVPSPSSWESASAAGQSKPRQFDGRCPAGADAPTRRRDGCRWNYGSLPVGYWRAVSANELPTMPAAWRSAWVDTYWAIGGQWRTSGEKGCPMMAAKTQYELGRIRNGGLPFTDSSHLNFGTVPRTGPMQYSRHGCCARVST